MPRPIRLRSGRPLPLRTAPGSYAPSVPLSDSSTTSPSARSGSTSASTTPTSSEGFPMPWSFTARRRQASVPSISDVGTAALVFSASKSSSSPHLPSLRPSSTYFSAGPPVVGDDHARWVSGPSVEIVKSMGGPGRLSRRNRPRNNRPKPVPLRNRSRDAQRRPPADVRPRPAAAAIPAATARAAGMVKNGFPSSEPGPAGTSGVTSSASASPSLVVVVVPPVPPPPSLVVVGGLVVVVVPPSPPPPSLVVVGDLSS